MTLVGFKITNHPQQVGRRGASDTVDERITPDKVFGPLQEEFAFTLDAAANDNNRKANTYFDLASNGLEQSWAEHRVWCNPPYSNIRPWVEKAWAEHRGGCPLIAMLLPANRCEQGWWQDLIEPFRDGRGPLETRFYRSRFNFGLPDNPEGKFHSSPPFGCVLVIWREGDGSLVRLERGIAHCLSHRLESFTNGGSWPASNPSNKTNGYAAAKVPDWQLRQWLGLVAAAQGIEAGTGETRQGLDAKRESPVGNADAPVSHPDTPNPGDTHD